MGAFLSRASLSLPLYLSLSYVCDGLLDAALSSAAFLRDIVCDMYARAVPKLRAAVLRLLLFQ